MTTGGHERCGDCGYGYDDLPRAELSTTVRRLATEHAARLTGAPPDLLRTRRSSGTWSPLEYGCHVRDVLIVQRERLALALSADTPRFASMRREERVVENRYNEQDPADVATRLIDAAGALAAVIDTLTPEGWARTGVYNYPTTQVRTLEWVVRHTIHEEQHHLLDVDRQLASPGRTPGER